MSIYSKSFSKKIIPDPNTSLHKIYSLLNKNSKSILDIGCSTGYFSQYIKENIGAEIWGIEIDPHDFKLAQKKLDKVILGNVDFLDFKKEFKEKKFDSVICADVLEHTINPANVLKKIRRVLSPEGGVFISVPNVTHQSVLIELLCGQWNYEKSGILDETHLKYFDYQGIIKIIEESGFYIQKIDYTISVLPQSYITKILSEHQVTLTSEIKKILNRPNSKVFQYIIKASPKKPKKYLSYSNQSGRVTPVSNWINDWENILQKYNHFNQGLDTLEQKNAELQATTSNQYLLLNKIYHSKTWKMLGYYKDFIALNKNILKKAIPIALRKKIKSILEAKFIPEQINNIIPPNILKEWRSWNYGPRKENSLDIINFSIIAWDFRFQRPQQLAKNLGELNHRVFYIKNEFLPHNNADSTFAPIKVEKKAKNIYEITLSATRNLFIYSDIPSEKDKQIMFASIKNLINQAQIANPIAKFDHPFWANVSDQLSMPTIYDCMDNHQGFSENGKHLSVLEKKLFQNSTVTLVTSKYLQNVASQNQAHNITLLPNAGDYQHFAQALSKSLEIPLDIQNIPHPIIGYYGALAEWFDTDILESVAQNHPDKSIVLIGQVTNQKINSLSKKYKNIYLLGEKSYQELPKYLQQFDVCTIPFILNDLIKATHPVKIFEFLAAGKPVVVTKMPEILNMKEIYFADLKNFSSQITVALKNKQKNIKKHQQIAKDNTWDIRAKYLISNLHKILFPKISIILLSYNSCDMAKNTIDSVLTRTFYPNYELIIVDNKSDQQTVDMLKTYQSIPNVKLIFNNENYGFAKGNNIGLKEAAGDYLILLNNDVLVTPGWLSRLLYHLQTTNNAGIVGPVTNSIGNEAKIDISYNPFEIKDLENIAYNYTSSRWGKTLNLNMVAAFCWIMPQDIYKKLGGLDERYGRGLFEDDDYCFNVKKHHYQILCAEDVFIHHFGGASFKKIQSKEYQQLFDDNKKKFENKWHSKWIPHRYRQ